MRASQVVENLPRFTPALINIAGLSSVPRDPGEGIGGFAEDLELLGVLPKFEGTRWGKVIPVDAGLNAKPHNLDLGTDRNGIAYGIMDVHYEIRNRLGRGLDAMGHLTDYGSKLGVTDKIRAGRAVRDFAGFAIVRATQVDFDSWRRGNGRGNDGEGAYIAQHRRSYQTLRPLMTGQFRRLADHAIATRSR